MACSYFAERTALAIKLIYLSAIISIHTYE